MNSREFLTGLGIIGLSFSSALSSAFVRAEKIDELFENETLPNLIFNLMNILAVAPELRYNIQYNARLRHLWHKITMEPDERKEDAHERKPHATKNILTALTILAAAIPTAIAHGVLFYDAIEIMFKDQYGIKLPNEQLTNEAVLFTYFFSAFGASQHWLHGAIELAEGASQQPPMRLLCSSGLVEGNALYDWLEWIIKNLTYDGGVNVLLLLAVGAEFGLFRSEFEERITYNPERLTEISTSFLQLISISLSFMSASMYLGHEGQAFLKIKQTVGREIHKIRQGEYNHISLEELLPKQLNALNYFSHAILHGLVRYQALIHLKVPYSIAIASASVSGLSRLGMFYTQDEHQAAPHIHLTQRESIKYDACQRGQDVMYEIFFIAVVWAASLRYKEVDLIDPNVVMLLSSFPALLCEAAMHLTAYARGDRHSTGKMDFIIDTITAPYLSMRIITGDYPINTYHLMDTAVGMVILSLFFRHVQKKLLSYPNVIAIKDKIVAISEPPLRQCSQWAQEKISTFRQHSFFTRPVEERKQEIDEEKISLLPRRQESCGERVSRYLSNCAASIASWCPFFSRSDHPPRNQTSHVARNEVLSLDQRGSRSPIVIV